ncbi:MAG TPA: S4 domain-containing protein [Solirubrobacteraceae bacterium]|nr:S4 domain-containing protein [Solirubrobacteraceae bacterium]
MRVDKWLWTARLFRTRGLAAEAVKGGRVHVDGVAVTPSREVGPEDRLEITVAGQRRTLIVRGQAEHPADQARSPPL